MRPDLEYLEPHSADGRSYIRRLPNERWLVVWRGIETLSTFTREFARKFIRQLKNESMDRLPSV